MCKLCNSDSPPILSSKQPINHVVKDYIGTFPCLTCVQALRNTERYNPSKSLDDIVITKLYNKYRAFNASQLSYAKTKASLANSILGIQPIFQRKAETIIYRVTINTTNGQIYLGLYPTLTEALEVKIKYMQEHNLVKGLTQLTNKLKELSCN